MILHNAATAWIALITAAVAWIQVLAGFAAIVLCALPLCIAPGVRVVRARREAQAAPGAPQGASRDSRVTGTPERAAQRRTGRPVPSWAHTEPYDYDEAA